MHSNKPFFRPWTSSSHFFWQWLSKKNVAQKIDSVSLLPNVILSHAYILLAYGHPDFCFFQPLVLWPSFFASAVCCEFRLPITFYDNFFLLNTWLLSPFFHRSHVFVRNFCVGSVCLHFGTLNRKKIVIAFAQASDCRTNCQYTHELRCAHVVKKS